MALVPLENPWKLDKDGRYQRDGKGERIPNPKAGQPKPRKEWTPEERASHDRQLEHFNALRRLRAARTLDPLHEAEIVLGGK